MTREYELIIGRQRNTDDNHRSSSSSGEWRANTGRGGQFLFYDSISPVVGKSIGGWDRFHRQALAFASINWGLTTRRPTLIARRNACAHARIERLDNLCEHDRSESAIVNAKRAWIFALPSRSFALSFFLSLSFFFFFLLSPTSWNGFLSSTKTCTPRSAKASACSRFVPLNFELWQNFPAMKNDFSFRRYHYWTLR